MAEERKIEIVKDRDPRRLVKLDPIDERIEVLAKRGVLLIGGGIGEGAANMLFLSMINLRITQPNKPIWLMLKSGGGHVDEGLAIVDIIRAFIKSGTQVNILGIGLVASMAVCIMQAASRRYSFPSTQFMIHEVSQEIMVNEKASESDERNAEIKRINNIVISLLADRSGMDKKQLMIDVRKTDVWLDADAAKKFGPNGLIDEIVDVFPFEL